MILMYIPQHFKIHELVPREIYESYPRKKHINLWFLFDDRVLYTQDSLRNRYGKMICNTWFWGGQSEYRGWRPQDCVYGSQLSQHKRGCAIDSLPQETPVEAIRKDILADPWHDDFKFITCIEENISWLHQDSRNWDKSESGIFIIIP